MLQLLLSKAYFNAPNKSVQKDVDVMIADTVACNVAFVITFTLKICGSSRLA